MKTTQKIEMTKQEQKQQILEFFEYVSDMIKDNDYELLESNIDISKDQMNDYVFNLRLKVKNKLFDSLEVKNE